MTGRRVGIFGGTFDPVHSGHIDLAASVQETLDLTTLFVIPSHVPPHRPQPAASRFHRFAMVSMAVAGHPGWLASDVEIARDAPSYTETTLRWFHEDGYQPAELFFAVGADAFADIRTWKDYPKILDGAHFVVVSRPNHPVDDLRARIPELASRMTATFGRSDSSHVTSIILIDAATADVSSTAIRRRLAQRLSISGMVHPSVQQHIEQHGLYASGALESRQATQSANTTAGRLHGQS